MDDAEDAIFNRQDVMKAFQFEKSGPNPEEVEKMKVRRKAVMDKINTLCNLYEDYIPEVRYNELGMRELMTKNWDSIEYKLEETEKMLEQREEYKQKQ